MTFSKMTFALLATPALLTAQTSPKDTAVKVTFGGFVDGYYAWDFSEPQAFDRSLFGGIPFTTQPARHNEFNVNLAFVEARLEAARVRGRVAIQAGTSVQSNYAAEAAIGVISGPSLSQMIQEAVVGTRISENVWVDGGIFFSHMGMESWISRNNPTYTRSLVADYSPYYQSGAKLTWTPSKRLTAQLDVVNGWQNISENNTGKGVGVRLDFTPNAGTTLSYYNFFSDELGNLLRTFNGLGAKVVRGKWTWLGEADYGTQDGGTVAPNASWYGLLGIARVQLSSRVALAGRLERFDDADQVILITGIPGATFRANGASVGVDVTPAPRVLWRTEARGFRNPTAVFSDRASVTPRKSSAFVVSSLALTF